MTLSFCIFIGEVNWVLFCLGDFTRPGVWPGLSVLTATVISVLNVRIDDVVSGAVGGRLV